MKTGIEDRTIGIVLVYIPQKIFFKGPQPVFLNHKDATITKQVVDVRDTVSDTTAIPCTEGEGVAHGG